MPKYLKHFPKPLLSELVQNRWIPIVGAGMSLNAIVRQGDPIPLWKGLGESLADDLNDYASDSPLDVISAYEHQFERVRLIERLTNLLAVERSSPGKTHESFCNIPFDIVCTTNFDFLLELQYRSVGRYCRPVMDEDQLSISVDRDPLKTQQEGRAVTLLKLHGDLHHPQRMVATENDYDAFLQRYPLISTYLANLLISRTAVLIGYSLDDPDIRQIWNLISSRLGKLRRPAYSIAVAATESYIEKFARRGVKVVNLPGNKANTGAILAEAFDELRDYFTANSLAGSQAVEEESLQQFKLPIDAASRLCFFSVPLKWIPLYRQSIYPIAREFGFVPTSADEVIAPGDAIMPKVQALIGRAEVVVVDGTSANTAFELRLALARLGPSRVLLITDGEQDIPMDASYLRILTRPEDFSVDGESFVQHIRDWFKQVSDVLEPKISGEPRRLLGKGEYRAALISVVSLLEVTLREYLPRFGESKGSPSSLRGLIIEAMRVGALDTPQAITAHTAINMRNDLVHKQGTIGKDLARRTVLEILDLVAKLKDQNT